MHPPSNPRISNTWRSLPPNEKRPPPNQEGGTAPTPIGDVEMSTSTPAIEDKAEENEQPDWHLFHALQSTRGAMEELRQLAREPIKPRDLNEREVGTSVGVGAGSSVGTPGTGGGTPSYLNGPIGGRLRAISNVGSSPLAR